LEDPSGLFSRVSPETAPKVSTPPRKGDSSDWLTVHRDDLNLARIFKTNLFVVGTERLVLSLISSLAADVNSDVIQCRDGLFRLPPPSSQAETVVLRDVDALNQEEQLRLLDWVDSATNGSQVISTASAPLLRLVEARAFDAALYYRLNTVYIDLTGERSRPGIY